MVRSANRKSEKVVSLVKPGGQPVKHILTLFLTLSTLGKILNIFLIFFFMKIGFDIHAN